MKSEIIAEKQAAAEAAAEAAAAQLQTAHFELRDALSLPEDPVEKLWEISVEANRPCGIMLDPAHETPSPDSLSTLGTVLRRLGFSECSEAPVQGDNRRACLRAFTQPAPIFAVYFEQNVDTGDWSASAPVGIAWTEAAAA